MLTQYIYIAFKGGGHSDVISEVFYTKRILFIGVFVNGLEMHECFHYTSDTLSSEQWGG